MVPFPVQALTVALVLVVGTVGTPSPCHVDCSHYGTTPGDYADDPMDCHKHYICFSATTWSTYPFDCEEGMNFDTVSKTCMAEGYSCPEPCQRCTFSCDHPILDQAADSGDCSTYYRCSEPNYPHKCPNDKPYFDGYMCQKDIKECCTCKPQCTEGDALNHRYVPDYLNCTNYYLCLVPGVPDSSSHGHCPFGNFDVPSGQCLEGSPCTTPCLEDPDPVTCLDALTCTETGYFPRCTGICDPYYFHCTEADIGLEVQPDICAYDKVVDPFSVICVPPHRCPVRQSHLPQWR
ncbi:uncharacterized protein [Panulirus ornatus]|uniref:uncharacterized protein n=1 Tax=Panulirus ornatus TaxID=150431 RepID=UPI003A890CF4